MNVKSYIMLILIFWGLQKGGAMVIKRDLSPVLARYAKFPVVVLLGPLFETMIISDFISNITMQGIDLVSIFGEIPMDVLRLIAWLMPGLSLFRSKSNQVVPLLVSFLEILVPGPRLRSGILQLAILSTGGI
jgi:hypothetical protein